MKNKKPIFTFDKETGHAKCILREGSKRYEGHAFCHEDDDDMMSEKTGCEIAFRRAKINLIRSKKNEIRTSLKALNHLYNTMKHSKHFNPNSYENKMLQRQIRDFNLDLDIFKDILATEEQMLMEYLEEKDKFYKRIRANRKKADLN